MMKCHVISTATNLKATTVSKVAFIREITSIFDGTTYFPFAMVNENKGWFLRYKTFSTANGKHTSIDDGFIHANVV
jgi:hypothetical protein